MVTLTKTFEFAASHRLFRPDWDDEKNRAVFGKCANPNGHGHNYQLEVSVAGEISSETGMVFDAEQLSRIVDELVFNEVDHKNLNRDVEWLAGKITTVEVIAESIWQRLAYALRERNPKARLHRIKLWETSRIYAVIEE
jgi:6-pyruvoyltetrahydropterin/6-carboxytetrahydropterin synthase